MQYVLGFAFNKTTDSVILIEKKRPAWQAGKFNGVGGKINTGELPAAAMTREFQEETGVEVKLWHHFADMQKGDPFVYEEDQWSVSCWYAVLDDATYYKVRTVTDEIVKKWPLTSLPAVPVIPNMRWLIPLALDVMAGIDYHIVTDPQ